MYSSPVATFPCTLNVPVPRRLRLAVRLGNTHMRIPCRLVAMRHGAFWPRAAERIATAVHEKHATAIQTTPCELLEGHCWKHSD